MLDDETARAMREVLFDDDMMREAATPEDIRGVADAVRRMVCQCCGADPDETLPCGHQRCELCKMRGHRCLACVFAT